MLKYLFVRKRLFIVNLVMVPVAYSAMSSFSLFAKFLNDAVIEFVHLFVVLMNTNKKRAHMLIAPLFVKENLYN